MRGSRRAGSPATAPGRAEARGRRSSRPAGARCLAVAVGVAVTAFLGAGLAACGAEGTDRVTVGLAGAYRTGSWTPVVVEVAAGPADESIAVWAEDPDGQAVRSPPMALETTAAGTRRARVRIRPGRPAAPLRVDRIGADGRAVAGTTVDPPRALDSSERLIVVVGDLPMANRAARLSVREGRPRVVSVADPGSLGTEGLDFSAADVIVVCGRAVAAVGEAGAPGLAAIDEWVRQGGQLVLVAGKSAGEPSFRTSPAAAWLPGPQGRSGTVDRFVPLRRAGAIETYAHSARPLDRALLDGVEVPLLADSRSLDGVIEAYEGSAPGDLPLVVRSPRGFGTVTWAGVDIDAGGMREWPGTELMLLELLGGPPPSRTAGRTGESAVQGQDLTGQLRVAIDRFAAVAPVPFQIIAGLSILYIAFLYPFDWWLASGGRRDGPAGRARGWVAWLSLPVGVALFAAAAWGIGQRWKGTSWRSSQTDLVDVDTVTGAFRALSLAGIWSPANDTLTVTAAPSAALPAGPPRLAVSWLAASGRGIGATDATTSHPGLATGDYSATAALDGLDGVPVAAHSSRLFEATWNAATTAPVVAATLRRAGPGALRGSVENRLPFPLGGCYLVHAGWMWDVGDLAPGGRFEAFSGRSPRSFVAGLTRRTTVKDREVNERWDITNRDPLRILEIVGFHTKVGGSGYTALEAGRLGRYDLSPLLDVDRAVLVGRGPVGTAWRELAAESGAIGDREADGAALWRIVIPVAGGVP